MKTDSSTSGVLRSGGMSVSVTVAVDGEEDKDDEEAGAAPGAGACTLAETAGVAPVPVVFPVLLGSSARKPSKMEMSVETCLWRMSKPVVRNTIINI
jgi:hypothetical protein